MDPKEKHANLKCGFIMGPGGGGLGVVLHGGNN